MRRPLYPGLPRPILFAHRGLSSEAPENTFAAFKLALERGIPALELDVHLTADGQVVVIHDHETRRVGSGVDRAIEKSNWKDLSGIDVGLWKGERWKDERIPLLADLLDALGVSAHWDIELKNHDQRDYGLEAAVSKVIGASRHGAALAERCAISSFNPWAIARFRALDGSIPVGIIWHNHGEMPAFLRHGEGRWIGHADFLKPSRKLVRASSSWRWRALEGFEFLVWTVDEAAEAHRLVDLHASGIISNRADGLGLPIVGP